MATNPVGNAVRQENSVKPPEAGFVRDEEGQDLIEYSLLGALISIISALVVTSLGASVSNFVTIVVNAFP
jgi:Flp pilus assembly pilin Flp